MLKLKNNLSDLKGIAQANIGKKIEFIVSAEKYNDFYNRFANREGRQNRAACENDFNTQYFCFKY